MPPAKPALQREPPAVNNLELSSSQRAVVRGPRRLSGSEIAPVTKIHAVPIPSSAHPRKDANFQPRIPVITGEATYRGLLPVDGIISGQLGTNGSALSIKQRPHNGTAVDFGPELNGEIAFKDMLRINGHVAGKVSSSKGTLIVDASARVDADIEVAVCVINGSVNGDVLARERLELGAGAVVFGNILAGAIKMKTGAVFHGDCRMLKNGNGNHP